MYSKRAPHTSKERLTERRLFKRATERMRKIFVDVAFEPQYESLVLAPLALGQRLKREPGEHPGLPRSGNREIEPHVAHWFF